LVSFGELSDVFKSFDTNNLEYGLERGENENKIDGSELLRVWEVVY
jgi:hypothetical protein